MRQTIKRTSIVMSIALVAVTLLPTLVSAEVQTAVTEIAGFAPYEDNNDEIVNIANDTIELNYQTWDPLPPGVFVGGFIGESMMELAEYPLGIEHGIGATAHYSELLLTQPMKLAQDYVMTGASQWVARLPVAVGEYEPSRVWFYCYKMDDANDYDVVRRAVLYGTPTVGDAKLDVVASDGDELHLVGWGTVAWPSPPTTPSSWTYVRDGRIYCQITAPLHAGDWYLLVCHVLYPADSKFQFYLCPSDLFSDNSTASTIAYEYHPASDQNVTRIESIPADLGFSFVFQAGLGINAVSYTRMFSAGDQLQFFVLVPIGSNYWHSGSFNLIMEFRVNVSQNLTWGAQASTTVYDGADNVTYYVLNHAYWTGMTHNSLIVASNPGAFNYTSTTFIGGQYYIRFTVTIFIEAQQRVEFLLVDDAEATLYHDQSPYQRLWHFNGAGYDVEMLFFNPWATGSIDGLSLNWTGTTADPLRPGFWEGVARWWDKYWMDIVGVALIVGGILLIPFTLGGSFLLVSMGVGMLLYENWPAFRDFVNNLVRFVLDGLEWLGEWLWKIGMAIWKALTWFVDQLIYYGAILLGLFIVGTSIALLVFPLKWEIGILSAFESLARGDTERARKQFGETTDSMRGVGSTLSGGRL